MKEIEERLEAERQREEADERRVTRSQVDKPGTSTETEPIPVGSPKRRQTEEDQKDAGAKKPKTQERTDVGNKKPKTPERKNVGGKKPKTPTHKDKGGKKPKTPTRKTNDDVDKLEDRWKETETEKDKGTKRTKTPANSSKATEEIDDVDKAESRKKRQKKTTSIPLLEEDDDNADDDLMVIDDKDKDEDYKPQEDEQDDEDYQMLDDDDDDFQEPPPRARKPVKKEQLKKHSTQRCVDKSSKEDTADIDDETLSLFQKIVGDNFEIKASEEFEQERKDRCINPVEAAGFRATMKTLALELKKAVKKGKRVKEIYTDMIESTIKIATAMKYPGASTVETEEILASIKDINCNAWRKHLQGKTTMEPVDMVLDEDNEEPPNKDILIEQPMLGKEATDAAAEAIKNLPKMLMADTNKKLRTLFNEMEKAH